MRIKTLKNEKKLSLHFLILVTFLSLTSIATVMVGAVSFRNSRRAVNEVAFLLRSEINARIQDHVQTFLRLPIQINQTNARAITRGTLDAGDQDALVRRFGEQVSLFESVTSINFGNTRGGLANAGREGSRGDRYEIVTEEFESGRFLKFGTEKSGERAALLDSVPHFDARQRPWYSDAVDRGGDTWSEIYPLATGQDLSFSVSRPVYSVEGELLGVVGVNLFLSHLADFLANLTVGQSGLSFIMERSGLLIATSTGERVFAVREGDARRDRVHATASAVPQTAHAAAALLQHYRDPGVIAGPREFEFDLAGARHFGQVIPLGNDQDPDWVIVTVIPEKDFMYRIEASNRTAGALITVMLVLIAGAGIFLTRRIIRPVALLTVSARALAERRWDDAPLPFSRIREISILSRSFSLMAEQLQETIQGLTGEIRNRERAESALARKNRELEQVVYVASHDLRSPLVNIDGYSRELEITLAELTRSPLPAAPEVIEDIDSSIGYIRRSVTQMDALLAGLLKLSRFGRAALRIEPLNMTTLVREVADTLEFGVREQGVDLTVGDLPPCLGDAVQVRQVFSNLLGNALKFLDPARSGRVTVSGSIQGAASIYCVEDNGIGIAPAHQEHVFEVFHRLDPSRNEGEGLGLSIARQILGRSDGEIRVESTLGQGSRFFVSLPSILPDHNTGESEHKG